MNIRAFGTHGYEGVTFTPDFIRGSTRYPLRGKINYKSTRKFAGEELIQFTKPAKTKLERFQFLFYVNVKKIVHRLFQLKAEPF